MTQREMAEALQISQGTYEGYEPCVILPHRLIAPFARSPLSGEFLILTNLRNVADRLMGTGISIKSRSVPPESDLSLARFAQRYTTRSRLLWSDPSHLQKEKIDVTHKQDCPCGSSVDNA
jgi:hypothetical protein